MKKLISLALMFILALTVAVDINAQSDIGGILSGRIYDQDNNPFSGVTVILEGPAYMGQGLFVTDKSGGFVFNALPPNDRYRLLVEMPEYESVIYQDLVISAGHSSFLKVVMTPSQAYSEKVLTGKSLGVDIDSAKISSFYSRHMVGNMPLARNLEDVIKSLPYAVPDDSAFSLSFANSGETDRYRQIALNGFSQKDPMFSYFLANLNFDAVEDVEMVLSGFDVETGSSQNGFVNILTNSGSNDLNFGLFAEYYGESMQKSLLSEDDLAAVGLEPETAQISSQDYALDFSGPVLGDIAWFYTNVRFSRTSRNFSHLDWALTHASGDSSYVIDKTPWRSFNVFGKASVRADARIKASVTYNLGLVDEDYYGARLQDNFDLSAFSKRDGELDHLIVAQINYKADRNFFVDGRVGFTHGTTKLLSSNKADLLQPRLYDSFYDMYAQNSRFEEKFTRQRINPSVSGTYFAEGFMSARHELKFGGEYEWISSIWDFWRYNAFMIEYFKGEMYAYPDEENLNRTLLSAYTSGPGERSSMQKGIKNRISAFVRDNLTFKDRFTLSLGIRFDFNRGNAPGQYHVPSGDPYEIFDVLPGLGLQYGDYVTNNFNFPTWINFSPHVGFAFDLFGNGSVALKGSYSRNYDDLRVQYVHQVHPLFPQLSSWYWVDANEDKLPDAEDAYTLVSLADDPQAVSLEDRLDNDVSAPYTDDYSIGIEAALGRDLSFSAAYIYRHKQNILGSVNNYGSAEESSLGYATDSPYWESLDFIDPGPDGQLGSTDDISSFLYAELADAPMQQGFLTNIPGLFSKYSGLHLVLNKRMAHNWQLLASLTWSKAWGNYNLSSGDPSVLPVRYLTPNDFILAEGNLYYDRPLSIKIQGSFIFPYSFMLSAYFNYRSGFPWNRTVSVFIPTDEKYYNPGGLYTVATEAPGSQRANALTTLDLRLEKKIHLSGSSYLGAYLDIINTLGRTGFTVMSDSGGFIDLRDPENPIFTNYPDNGAFAGAYGSRIFKIGLRLVF